MNDFCNKSDLNTVCSFFFPFFLLIPSKLKTLWLIIEVHYQANKSREIFKVNLLLVLNVTFNQAVSPWHIILVPLKSRGLRIVRVTLMEEPLLYVTLNTTGDEDTVKVVTVPCGSVLLNENVGPTLG